MPTRVSMKESNRHWQITFKKVLNHFIITWIVSSFLGLIVLNYNLHALFVNVWPCGPGLGRRHQTPPWCMWAEEPLPPSLSPSSFVRHRKSENPASVGVGEQRRALLSSPFSLSWYLSDSRREGGKWAAEFHSLNARPLARSPPKAQKDWTGRFCSSPLSKIECLKTFVLSNNERCSTFERYSAFDFPNYFLKPVFDVDPYIWESRWEKIRTHIWYKVLIKFLFERYSLLQEDLLALQVFWFTRGLGSR